MFCQHICHLTGFYAHLCVKIIPLDHFYANIDDIISNFEYWEEKMVYNSIFGGARKWGLNYELWIFQVLWTEHFWGFKLIAWADIRVVLIFYSFQSFRVDVERVIEKFTQKTEIWNIQNSCHPTCLWENSSPALCVITFRKVLISSVM